VHSKGERTGRLGVSNKLRWHSSTIALMIDYTNLIFRIRLLYAVVIPLLRFQDGPAEVHTCLISRKTHLSARTEGNSVGLPWAVNHEWFFLLGAWWITTTPFKDYWYFRKGIQEGRHGSIDMLAEENSLITIDCPIRSKSMLSLLGCLGCRRLRMPRSRKPRGSWSAFS